MNDSHLQTALAALIVIMMFILASGVVLLLT